MELNGPAARPFQFPDHERLVVIWESPTTTAERQSVSAANDLDWRRQAATVQPLTAWEGSSAVLTARDGDGLWKRRVDANPRIIGSQVRFNDEPYPVVGIAPARENQ